MMKAIRVVLLMGTALLVPLQAHAQFGLCGNTQFNPCIATSNPWGGVWLDWANRIEQLSSIKQQATLMVQQVKQMEGMLQNYGSRFASLSNLNPSDVYGNITALGNAANTGSGASGGYSAATVPLVFQNINGLPMEAVRRLKTRYGDTQLSDASNQNDWTLIGNVRANAQQNTTALASLSNDSLASDATTLQVAQKANAAQALTVQQLNTLQQVSAAQLEQQVEAAQRERNRAAVQMANEIAFSQSSQALKQSTRGLGDGLKGINPGE